MKKLEEYVVSIPDFPEPGIIFRDVTSILRMQTDWALAIDSIREMDKRPGLRCCGRTGIPRI